jgi:hypothetical protein
MRIVSVFLCIVSFFLSSFVLFVHFLRQPVADGPVCTREYAWRGIEGRIIFLLFFLKRRSSRVVVRGMNSAVSMSIKYE